MKIGKITKVTTQGVVEEGTIEVSGWKILIGLLSAGLITGLVTAFTFILIDLPNNNLNKEKNSRSGKFDLLNFVLRAKSDTIRKESLIFLLKSEVLLDENGEIENLINKNIVPDWSDMPKKNETIEQNEIVPIPAKEKNKNNLDETKVGIQKE